MLAVIIISSIAAYVFVGGFFAGYINAKMLNDGSRTIDREAGTVFSGFFWPVAMVAWFLIWAMSFKSLRGPVSLGSKFYSKLAKKRELKS